MRRTNGRVMFLLLAGVLGMALQASAQQGTAEIRGRVADSSGGTLPGVTVIVRNQASGVFRQGNTTADGTYYLAGVIPGVYELSAEISGFRKYTHKDIRLEVGKTATVDIKMEVGGVSEELTVSAEAPIVDVTSKEVGGSLTSQDLISLPSINRNFVGFIGLLPGIVPSISTESFGSDSVSANGQDARNNNYLVDGANNNDDVIGQRAGTQARTPIESIQEFQVLTSQYDAEFGRTSGAVVNAVTKQGGNQFKGSAFYFLQDASYTAKDFFVKQSTTLTKPDTKFVQYGFTLGGPVIKDKAHFFVSLERVENDRATTINIPALNLLSSPVTTDRVWNTLIRFDHQLNAKHSWNVRWLRETSPQKNQIVPVSATVQVTEAAAREEADLDQTVVATLNSAFTNSIFNAFRVGYTQEDVAFANPNFNANGGRGDQLLPSLQFQTFSDQQSSVMQARVNDAYQFDDTISWAKGKHSFRGGLQYEYVKIFSSAQDNWNGTFFFSTSNVPFDRNNPRTYPDRLQIRVPGPSEYTQKEHFFTAFAQDKWRTSDRLTLSLGLRYDLEKIPLQELDNPRFASADDYPVDTNNISPRLGFAYDLKGDGKSVVRGGVGRFYDKSHLELISAIITNGVKSRSFVVNFPASGSDPGPAAGRLPTEQFLVNGPTVNRTLLNQLYAAGATLPNTGNVTLDNPDRVVPYTDQISLGFERQLSRDMSVNLDYVHAFGRDQFLQYNLNPGLRATTARAAAVARVNPAFVSNVFTTVNDGTTEYDAIQFGLEKRYSHGYQARLSYTYSKGRGNTSGNGVAGGTFQLLNDLRLGLNEGPTDFDRPHNVVFSGAVEVPRTHGLIFSTVVRFVSGTPYTIQDTTLDADRDGILFEPIAAGSYSGTGANAVTVENDGGRNGARGPSFFQADARLGYRVKVGGARRVELFAECFNLTDRANFANPNGDRFTSTTFLRTLTLRAGAGPRTAQFGARFEF